MLDSAAANVPSRHIAGHAHVHVHDVTLISCITRERETRSWAEYARIYACTHTSIYPHKHTSTHEWPHTDLRHSLQSQSARSWHDCTSFLKPTRMWMLSTNTLCT